jgi:hypothetical protein
MRIIAAAFFAFAATVAPWALGAPTNDIADALAEASVKPITSDSLPSDFSRLTRFVRHDANGLVLYTDGGPTDGYVRHAQAHFDLTPSVRKDADKIPLFSVEFELADQPDFTYEGVAAALEQRLGTPSAHSDQPGAVFRTWLLKKPEGRTITLARADGSDNGDPTIVFQLIQNR